jgi:hypothetical protein
MIIDMFSSYLLNDYDAIIWYSSKSVFMEVTGYCKVSTVQVVITY